MARDFNGSSDKLNFGDATNLAPQLGMTVAAWINTDSVSGEACIITRGRAGVNGFNFQRVSGDELRISKHGVVDINSTTINIPVDTWVLVAAVVSSTQVRFHKYVPGSGLTSQNVSNSQSFTGTPTETRVGCLIRNTGAEQNFWDGEIAETAKWNRELSDDEITALGLGFSPLFFLRDLQFYSNIFGNYSPEIDYKGGFTGTVTGTTKTAHPRIIYPSNYNIPHIDSGGGTTTSTTTSTTTTSTSTTSSTSTTTTSTSTSSSTTTTSTSTSSSTTTTSTSTSSTTSISTSSSTTTTSTSTSISTSSSTSSTTTSTSTSLTTSTSSSTTTTSTSTSTSLTTSSSTSSTTTSTSISTSSSTSTTTTSTSSSTTTTSTSTSITTSTSTSSTTTSSSTSSTTSLSTSSSTTTTSTSTSLTTSTSSSTTTTSTSTSLTTSTSSSTTTTSTSSSTSTTTTSTSTSISTSTSTTTTLPPSSGTATYLQTATDASDSNTYTFASQNFGSADSGRYIIVTISSRGSGETNATINSVSIGGVSASIVVQERNQATNINVSGIAIASVPTGTSGDIVVTFSTTMLRCIVSAYRVTGISGPTPYDTDKSTASPPSVALDIPADGFAIAEASTGQAGSSFTWSGLTEKSDTSVEFLTSSSALDTFSTIQVGRTITATPASSTNQVGVFASWGFGSPTTTSTTTSTTTTSTSSSTSTSTTTTSTSTSTTISTSSSTTTTSTSTSTTISTSSSTTTTSTSTSITVSTSTSTSTTTTSTSSSTSTSTTTSYEFSFSVETIDDEKTLVVDQQVDDNEFRVEKPVIQ